MNKKIAIIIPTYNRKNLTEKCVNNLPINNDKTKNPTQIELKNRKSII